MKRKYFKKPVTVHQYVEYFFRHRLVLIAMLLWIGVGLCHYPGHTTILVKGGSFDKNADSTNTIARQEEITRMSLDHGDIRFATIAGK